MMTVASLYAAVVRHLSGRNVVVKWERPPVKEYAGQVFRYGDTYKVYIDPSSGEDLLFVALHESAHVRLHGPKILDGPARVSSEKLLQLRKTDPVTRYIERQAEDLTAAWMTYAERNYKRFPGDTPEVQKLYCLLGMKQL